MSKANLPTKLCAACGRPFAWRRKWARDWAQVRFCSDACRNRRRARAIAAASPDAGSRTGGFAEVLPRCLQARVLRPLASLAQCRPRALLVAYCLLCWLPGWFTIPATDRDEARFVQATKQMLESGDFIDIRNGAEARNRKPIGIYWLQALPAAVARALNIAAENPIWPYRLPSLLGALLGVLATFAIGERLAGRSTALLASAMLGGSALLTAEAHVAKTDAALLGVTTVAMGVLARAYLAPARVGRMQAAGFWLALGAGVLLKGPITPMVAGLTAATVALADRRAGWLTALRPSWGVPLALAVVLPWLVAIEISTHGQFLRDAVGGDMGRKLVGGDNAHGAPPGTYVVLLALTLFPAGFVALRALPAAWAARREPATRFLLAWAGPAWLVFEAVPTKLPHYMLPLYPALCLLGAQWAGGGRGWRRVSLTLFVVAGGVFAAGAMALPLVVGTGVTLGVPAALAAGLVVAVALRSRAAWAGLLAVPLLWWAILAVELPHLSQLWVSARVAAWLDRRPVSGFAAVGYAEPSLMFAAGTGTQFLDAAAAARFLAADSGRVVAVAERQVGPFLVAAGRPAPHAFATVRGFDYSVGRAVALTLFRAGGGETLRR